MAKQWAAGIVIGASSGIGEALARQLARDGTRVALVARRIDLLQRICREVNDLTGEERAIPFQHDVRDTEAAEPLLQEIATTLGALDLVVYSSGIMINPGPESYPTEQDVAAIQTNLAGAVAWLNATASRFSRQGSGTIVGISSIAGDRGRRGNPVYNATKAGLNVYLESLRFRLAQRGVKVVTVKPGWIRTPLLGDRRLPLPAVSAEDAAREIIEAAMHGRRVAYVPSWWRIFGLGLRFVPAPLFERLKIQ